MNISRFLVEHGANVSAQNINHVSPLQWSIQIRNFSKIINIDANKFIQFQFNNFPGSQELANYLINQGADVNAKTSQDFTPLLLAASTGDVDICKSLIKKGANVSAENIQKMQAIHYAVQAGIFF